MRDLTKDYRALSFFLLFLLWGSVILFNISSYTTHNSPSATQYEIEERFEQDTDEKPPLEAFDPYRGPIVIGSDEDFIDNPIVFEGEGTESDPYMIRYWIVDIAQDGNNTGIHIANTTKYFEINEVQIENGTNGIKLENVTNGFIAKARIENVSNGIYLNHVSNSELQSVDVFNSTTGIKINGSEFIKLNQPSIQNTRTFCNFTNSQGIELFEATFTHAFDKLGEDFTAFHFFNLNKSIFYDWEVKQVYGKRADNGSQGSSGNDGSPGEDGNPGTIGENGSNCALFKITESYDCNFEGILCENITTGGGGDGGKGGGGGDGISGSGTLGMYSYQGGIGGKGGFGGKSGNLTILEVQNSKKIKFIEPIFHNITTGQGGSGGDGGKSGDTSYAAGIYYGQDGIIGGEGGEGGNSGGLIFFKCNNSEELLIDGGDFSKISLGTGGKGGDGGNGGAGGETQDAFNTAAVGGDGGTGGDGGNQTYYCLFSAINSKNIQLNDSIFPELNSLSPGNCGIGGAGGLGGLNSEGTRGESGDMGNNGTRGILETTFGIRFRNTNDSIIVRNEIFGQNNTDTGVNNIYDDGELGNFWEGFDGEDTDPKDGIGDTPYHPEGSVGNGDRFPFLGTYNGDMDGDLITNIEEWFEGSDGFITNATNQDTDYDNILDYDEITIGTNPTNPDTDGDDLSDGDELVYGTDVFNQDSDEDGLLDGYEVHEIFTSPTNNDTDGDFMPDDFEDNWGLLPTYQGDGAMDADGDGISNLMEYIYGTNPRNIDSDNDNYSDLEELTEETDPNQNTDYPLHSLQINAYLFNELMDSPTLTIEATGHNIDRIWYTIGEQGGNITCEGGVISINKDIWNNTAAGDILITVYMNDTLSRQYSDTISVSKAAPNNQIGLGSSTGENKDDGDSPENSNEIIIGSVIIASSLLLLGGLYAKFGLKTQKMLQELNQGHNAHLTSSDNKRSNTNNETTALDENMTSSDKDKKKKNQKKEKD